MTIDPIDLVLRVAQATLGAGESPPGTNAGPYVERVLKRVGFGKGAPWCAAWVSDVGALALGPQWPVKPSASVVAICEWAKAAKCRHGAVATPAARGDLFALWYPKLGRFAHIGLVVSVSTDGRTVETLEGNTSGAGERDGWLVWSKTRTLTRKDCLIRWADAGAA